MTNYMPEVAKMLGVELGEVFEVLEYPSKKFQITNYGIERLQDGEWQCNIAVNSFILERLLAGEYTIKRKPWKPKDDEEYWLVNQCGNVISLNWIDNFLCITNYKIGNCYRTKEEAEANRDKWVAFYASDKVLEV